MTRAVADGTSYADQGRDDFNGPDQGYDYQAPDPSEHNHSAMDVDSRAGSEPAPVVKGPTRSRFASMRSSNDITVSAAAASALAKGNLSGLIKAGPSTAADVAATHVPSLDFDGPQYMFGGDTEVSCAI